MGGVEYKYGHGNWNHYMGLVNWDFASLSN